MCPEGANHPPGDGVVACDFKTRPGLRLREGGDATVRPPPVSVGTKDARRSGVNQLPGVAARAPARDSGAGQGFTVAELARGRGITRQGWESHRGQDDLDASPRDFCRRRLARPGGTGIRTRPTSSHGYKRLSAWSTGTRRCRWWARRPARHRPSGWRMRGSVVAPRLAAGCFGRKFEQVLALQDGSRRGCCPARLSLLPPGCLDCVRVHPVPGLSCVRPEACMCPEGVDHLPGDGVVACCFRTRPGLRLQEGGDATVRPSPVSVGTNDACRSGVNQLPGVAARAPARDSGAGKEFTAVELARGRGITRQGWESHRGQDDLDASSRDFCRRRPARPGGTGVRTRRRQVMGTSSFRHGPQGLVDAIGGHVALHGTDRPGGG